MKDRATATVVLVGVRGFGAVHLANVRRLRDLGRVTLTALVDPVVAAEDAAEAPADAPLFATLSEALAAVGTPDVVIAAVPIAVHVAVAAEALGAGADVLLEKPPFARMADLEALLDLERETGRVVQVGFQSLGSAAIDAFDADAFDVGPVRGVRALGTWVRRRAYWERSPWAGRRSIDGVDVVDGVVTNPLAHAVATALRIVGVQDADDVERVEVEMFRANAIDADDTTSLRVTPVDGPIVTAALTLCAAEDTDPVVEVAGARGTVTFRYTTDDVVVGGPAGETRHFDRIDLLEDLITHRADGTPLRVPLRSTGAYMRVVEAIRTGGDPIRIEPRWIGRRGTGSDEHPVVEDVAAWVRAAADVDGLFSEAGAPWASTGRDAVLARAEVDGHPVFDVLDGAGTTPSSSPRPYLHPVRTLGGVEVTATHPADHDWHTGLGFAVPDVRGAGTRATNFWGGGTYRRGLGYSMLDDHGSMATEWIAPAARGDGRAALDHTIAWHDRAGHLVVRELRTMRWTGLPAGATGGADVRRAPDGLTGWRLDLRLTLTAVDGPVSLGSPGSNGRTGAGYGGLFWRLPPCADVTLMTAGEESVDEADLLGRVSPWIAWSARFSARPGASGDATLVLVPDDAASAADPWFVRVDEYPGIGSAIAWEERVDIPEHASVSRGFRIAVLDGRLDHAGAGAVAVTLGASSA